MIIVGDTALPNEALGKDLKEALEQNASIFEGKNLIFNLEGAIINKRLTKTLTPVLYNHVSLLDALGCFNQKVACLSNNHLLDLPQSFDDTVHHLKEKNIAFAGGGRSFEAAHEPAIMEEDGRTVFVFNECWEFLLYHQKNPTDGVFLAELNFKKLIERVNECKRKNPNTCIIVYLHWSLDLETLPYPMYRKFAKSLIDAGVEVVAGSHSHCPQGGEKYKDGYIVYGLGNFFLPNHVFANGKLFYPSFASLELVFEYNVKERKAYCHWFRYKEENGKHSKALLESATFETSSLLKEISLFSNMSHTEYIPYFKKTRRKHFLIPVFSDYENDFVLNMLTGLLKTRARLARNMAKLKLIKWGS
jgi:hypothetical protein